MTNPAIYTRRDNTTVTELREIERTLRTVAEMLSGISPGTLGTDWVHVGGTVVRVSDLRCVITAHRRLRAEIKRRTKKAADS